VNATIGGYSMDIGSQIKHLRTAKKMSLRQLSEKTSLSIGFLSQLERGMTSVAVDSLGIIAKVFAVDLSYFFQLPQDRVDDVICSYEQTVTLVESDKFIHSYLSKNFHDKKMFIEMVTLIPENSSKASASTFGHVGEEFIYVLEGVLTLHIDDRQHKLNPGDSIHFHSTSTHNWHNFSNRLTKILVAHSPNPFFQSDSASL
jgi:transcriptional regulator with XRE-family HTH domain